MKGCVPGSLASRVLEVICATTGWINTTEILRQLPEVEQIVKVSMACRDLWMFKKINRVRLDGRFCYCARQLEIFPGAADGLETQKAAVPAHKQKSRKLTGLIAARRAEVIPVASKKAKLETIDRLIGFVAYDMAQVLKEIRADVIAARKVSA